MAQQEIRTGREAKVTMLDSWFPSLHLDGPNPTAPVASLIARQFRKTPKAIAEGIYFRTVAAFYRTTGKIPPNITQAQNFLPKLLSYSWYAIADRYEPEPASFPLAYIEGNEGQVMLEMERLVPSGLTAFRRVDAIHANVLDEKSLTAIVDVLRLHIPKVLPLFS